jgi:hypothetical protein
MLFNALGPNPEGFEWLGRLDSNQRMAVPKTALPPFRYARPATETRRNLRIFGPYQVSITGQSEILTKIMTSFLTA